MSFSYSTLTAHLQQLERGMTLLRQHMTHLLDEEICNTYDWRAAHTQLMRLNGRCNRIISLLEDITGSI